MFVSLRLKTLSIQNFLVMKYSIGFIFYFETIQSSKKPQILAFRCGGWYSGSSAQKSIILLSFSSCISNYTNISLNDIHRWWASRELVLPWESILEQLVPVYVFKWLSIREKLCLAKNIIKSSKHFRNHIFV